VTGFLIRKNPLAIEKNIEDTQSSYAERGLHPKFFGDQFFQADGPKAMLGSNQTALDPDLHAEFEFDFSEDPMLKIFRTIHTGATKT